MAQLSDISVFYVSTNVQVLHAPTSYQFILLLLVAVVVAVVVVAVAATTTNQ